MAPVGAFARFCAVRLFIAGVVLVFAHDFAVAQTEPSTPSVAEKRILEAATAGDFVDLQREFPNEADRKISPRFLSDLLTGAIPTFHPHRNGVRFSGAIFDDPFELSNARVPFDVWMVRCEFRKPVNFARTVFSGIAMFDGSVFQEDANFDSVKVGHIAFLRDTIFEGLANFNSANTAWQFDAKRAHFKNGALFNGMKVGQVAFFHDAVFDGPVDFRLADIGNNFEANGAKFTNKDTTAWFAMKCGRKGYFWEARFAGPISFVDSNFSDLFIGNEKSKGGSISSLDLTRCAIERQLKIQNTEIGDLIAPSMRVKGPASFVDIAVTHSADFSYGDFTTVDLARSSWPVDPKRFHIQGISYKYARADLNDERESHKKLLQLARQSAFTTDVYRNLEDLFSRQGYRSDADAAFIAGKQRERDEYFRSGEYLRWFGSLMIDGLVGYGRRPWRASILCALLIAFGCFVFRCDRMELQKPDKDAKAERQYNRFWYSLGLFLPFVNLQADNVWKPKKDFTFLRHYMRVHILLGWILIPIVLAALTGFIK